MCDIELPESNKTDSNGRIRLSLLVEGAPKVNFDLLTSIFRVLHKLSHLLYELVVL